MRTRIFSLSLVIFPALAAAQAPTPSSVSDVYELSTELTVSILPEPLRSFYSRNLTDLKSEVHGFSNDPTSTARPALPLDRGASSDDRRTRLDAIRKFSRTEAPIQGTTLLTVSTQTRAGLLRECLRVDGTAEETIDRTAELIVAATSAALPFNTTSGSYFGAADADGFVRDHQTRYHEVLIGRSRRRFESEMRIDPSRVKPTTKVADAVLDTAIEAYRWIDPLLDIEAAVAAELVAKPGEDLKKHEERFLDELADRAYPILEARIEAGALLAANLIVGAWMEAGKPALAEAETIPANNLPVAEVTLKVETKSAYAFVGSKDSTVFHEPDCVHLARVKPENRVTFEDAKAAIGKGRKPCKSCKPDAAPPATASP